MKSEEIWLIAQRIKAIADTGLLYGKNEYDLERYRELQEISLQLGSGITGKDMETLRSFYDQCTDYPTPKTDIRGIALNEAGEVLLVQESIDGKWSLPGGWADIGHTPAEVIVKEFREETGLEVVPRQLLALFDKKCHPHPPQPYYVYKYLFYCELQSTTIQKGFDILDAAFFAVDQLPPLSEDRILASQIQMAWNKIQTGDATTFFDQP
jgi:ADP-ribose pyrophosphatase YjhB (NUDIX family)